MVFATGAVSDQNQAAVATAFDACKSTRVVAVPNPGKRNGAMLPHAAWRRLDSDFVSAIKFYRARMGLSVRSDVAGRAGQGDL